MEARGMDRGKVLDEANVAVNNMIAKECRRCMKWAFVFGLLAGAAGVMTAARFVEEGKVDIIDLFVLVVLAIATFLEFRSAGNGMTVEFTEVAK